MLQTRRAAERGHANHGWLDSYHTFSFASYYDPNQMGFRSLRVMNEDRVAPGQGFGTHEHQDMEIVSFVLKGALEHKDSMGNGEVLRPGEFQRISAGKGITHSEFNPSDREITHFYQIWLRPAENGIDPSYEQKSFDAVGRQNQFQLVASPNAEAGSLLIHQDARIYLAELEPDKQIDFDLPTNRHAWLQVMHGKVNVNEEPLSTSDGIAISDEANLKIQATENSQIMLFDLA